MHFTCQGTDNMKDKIPNCRTSSKIQCKNHRERDNRYPKHIDFLHAPILSLIVALFVNMLNILHGESILLNPSLYFILYKSDSIQVYSEGH